MATVNEKSNQSLNITDLETFQIEDAHNVAHPFVSTLEVRLKLLGDLKKKTFYSRLRRLNTKLLKANPQQSKILKKKLESDANLFYLMPKSAVKKLIKQDCTSSSKVECESQAAFPCDTSNGIGQVNKMQLKTPQEQVPHTLNRFPKFPDKGTYKVHGRQLDNNDTIDKYSNSLFSPEHYPIESIEKKGSRSGIVDCKESSNSHYNITTDSIPESISEESSDTDLDLLFLGASSSHEHYSGNSQHSHASKYLDHEIVLEEKVTTKAKETPEAWGKDRSSSLGMNKNECKMFFETQSDDGTDDAEFSYNIASDKTANGSNDKCSWSGIVRKDVPSVELQTNCTLDGSASNDYEAIQTSNALRNSAANVSECNYGNNEISEIGSLIDEGPNRLVSKQKRLHETSHADFGLDYTTDTNIKKQRLSSSTKMEDCSATGCLTTDNYLKEHTHSNGKETSSTTGASIKIDDSCMKDHSIPVSKDIIEIVTKRRRAYGLDAALISQETLIDLSKFRKFWSKHLVAERPTAHLAPSTLCKILNRITQYFFFLSAILKKPPHLKDCENIDSIMCFINYLIKERNVTHGTAALFVQSLLYVAKYRNKSHFADDFKKVESVNKIRNLQAGLLRLYERGKKMADPENTKSKLKLMWTEILDVVRTLIKIVEEFSGGKIQEARQIHDLVLVLFVVSVSPNRNLDHMRLEIKDLRRMIPHASDELDNSNKESNYLVLLNDGRILLKDYVFKTAATYGSSCIELQDIDYLVDYLVPYIDKYRRRLLLSRNHPYLFMKASGDPFSTSSEFSVYLGNVFQKYGSQHITCNDIRKALVTFILDQQSTTPGLKKSLASLMKHGVRYQENVYYQRNYSQDKLEALNFLSNHTGKYLGLLNEDEDNATDQEDDDPNAEKQSNPEIGSIVALVSDASTWRSPEIFLAKLMQYTDKGKRVVLAEMQLVEGTTRCYRLRPGYSWKENIETLVWPVDVEFREKEQVYVLKTSLRELHSIVKP